MAKRSVKNSPTIFISYRREDTGGDAGRLNDALTLLLGPGRTFWDLEELAPGKDFARELKKALGASEILLALIGPKWETIADASGRPRLSNKDDLVRMEILAGLRRKALRVVPILLNRETVPKAADLPSVLVPLTKRNAFIVRRDRWHQDVEELLKRLRLSGQQTAENIAENSRGQQARFVSMSVEWKRQTVPDLSPRRWVVYIDNSSTAPIFVEDLSVTSPGKTPLSIDWGTVSPKSISDYELDESEFDPTGDAPGVSMRFRDADGERWTLRKGILKRLR
jgi:hypothetical protein